MCYSGKRQTLTMPSCLWWSCVIFKLLKLLKALALLKQCVGKRIFFMENKAATLKDPSKETYGFESKHHASQSKYLEAFEKDFFNMANSLKFRYVRND